MKNVFKSALLMSIILFYFVSESLAAVAAPTTQLAIVSVPVADIRMQNPETNEITPFIAPENSDDTSFFFADNKFQETQVLFGDTLYITKESGAWAFVEILDQNYFTESKEPVRCCGWINKSAVTKRECQQEINLVVKSLWAPVIFKTGKGDEIIKIPMGAKLSGRKLGDGSWKVTSPLGECKINDEHVQRIGKKRESIKDLRIDIVERAKLFLTSPYSWGGASAPKKFYLGQLPKILSNQLTGVDCSGLVYEIYKSSGLICPRNSNDQYLFSERIESGSSLKPGDLIFFAKVASDGKTPQRVIHVSIYAGVDEQENALIIESQGTAEPYGVRLIPSIKYARLGNKQLSEIKTGDIFEWMDERNKSTNLSCVCFGTFMTPQKLKDMRLDFLRG